jgi:hypothetical protein
MILQRLTDRNASVYYKTYKYNNVSLKAVGLICRIKSIYAFLISRGGDFGEKGGDNCASIILSYKDNTLIYFLVIIFFKIDKN